MLALVTFESELIRLVLHLQITLNSMHVSHVSECPECNNMRKNTLAHLYASAML